MVVQDVNFLKNTGHDFLIIFAAVGVLLLAKTIDSIIICKLKANRVSNEPR